MVINNKITAKGLKALAEAQGIDPQYKRCGASDVLLNPAYQPHKDPAQAFELMEWIWNGSLADYFTFMELVSSIIYFHKVSFKEAITRAAIQLLTPAKLIEELKDD